MKNELQSRIKNSFAHKELAAASAVLLTAQPNIYYFTNFTGHDSWAILTPKKTIILTDGRYTLQAREESPHANIFVRKGQMVKLFAEVAQDASIKQIALFSTEITLALMDQLKTPKIKYQKLSSKPIDELRQIKSSDEINRIKKAVMIAEKAYKQLLEELKPGLSENHLAAILEFLMRTNGAEKAAFDIIIASGQNSAKPHARTTNKKIKAGEPITIDWGALANGYNSDLTRTLYIGKIPPYHKNIYELCLEAQRAGIEAIKPGEKAENVDTAARNVITKAGYGDYFNHGLGHGLGLDVHELPTLTKKSQHILKPGMIVTVEPGIYVPQKGGLRIEDDVLVTENGYKVLSSLPKNVNEVVI